MPAANINPDGTLGNLGVRDAEPTHYVGSGIVNDSQENLQGKIIAIMNSNLSAETKDYLVQYYMNDNLSSNAFSREYEASKHAYQNTVKDLQKAGISPFLAFDSLRSGSPSSSAGSVAGGNATNRKNTQMSNFADIGSKVLTVLAIIAAAYMRSMA